MTQTLLLVLARSAGFVFRAPGFTHPSVPPMVRAALAFGLAWCVAPGVAPHASFDLGALTLAIAAEVGLGAAIGFAASLLYDGAYYAGRMVDDAVGIRASVPTANVTSAQGFGRLWSSVFLAGFFLLDGHAIVIRAFAASFAHVGAGVAIGSDAWRAFALVLPTTIVQVAFAIASPAIALVALVQLGLAAAGRIVPRFGNIAFAFPIVFGAALVMTIVTIPLFAPLAGRPWLPLPWELAK